MKLCNFVEILQLNVFLAKGSENSQPVKLEELLK